MPRRTGSTTGADAGSAVSGFGGHRLAALPTVSADSAPGTTLAELGFEDAEQVAAASAVPGVDTQLQDALGLSEADYRALVASAVQVLPADRASLVSTPTSTTDLHLGALEPTEEMTAELATLAGDVAPALALPAAVNLITGFPQIRNQASRGTCVAFTLTALHEYALGRAGIAQDLSEQHLYYEVKQIDGAPAQCGTWQAKAVLPLAGRGQCRELIWPYNPNPPCNNHGPRPAQARPDGLNYRLATHAVPANDVDAYKAELARDNPVGMSIPVYDSWYRSAEVRRSGRITMRLGNETQSGGHAVALVGYQDSPTSPGGGYFLVRNQWSTGWAYQSPYGPGYGTIPYQYIIDDAWEAYAADLPAGASAASTAETTSSVVITVGPNITITVSSR